MENEENHIFKSPISRDKTINLKKLDLSGINFDRLEVNDQNKNNTIKTPRQRSNNVGL